MTLAETCSEVRIAKNSTNPFEVKKGFRQGDALSCDLFNICLEMIIRKAELRTNNSSILTKSIQLLGYADDIDIISRTQEELSSSFSNIRNAAETMGLVVNVEKTKYMRPGTSNQLRHITVCSARFRACAGLCLFGKLGEHKKRHHAGNQTKDYSKNNSWTIIKPLNKPKKGNPIIPPQ